MDPKISKQQQTVVDVVLSSQKLAESLVGFLAQCKNDPEVLAAYVTQALTNAAATLPPIPEARIEKIDGHQAVVGKMLVFKQVLETLLSEGSFGKSREEQISYGKKLGYRLATGEENRAYVGTLLEKEIAGSGNTAEQNALETYRKRCVRDTTGGHDVVGIRVRSGEDLWYGRADSGYGALFVRVADESK